MSKYLMIYRTLSTHSANIIINKLDSYLSHRIDSVTILLRGMLLF